MCVDTLEDMLRVVFGQRRKKLSNSLKLLKGITNKEIDQLTAEAKIDMNLRPENLSVSQWCSLSILYKSLLSSKPNYDNDNNNNNNNNDNKRDKKKKYKQIRDNINDDKDNENSSL